MTSRPFAQELIEFYRLEPRPSLENEFENIYQLPLQPVYRDETNKIRICQFGYSKVGIKEVNILVIGTTGSGKSTAINALINYIAGVQFDDDYRLEIVSLEESERSSSRCQADSQTDWITVYKIGVMNESKLQFQVNIVDTPGFGDTRGKQRDMETFTQIKHLFQYSLTNVNAVCITVNGTEPRLNDRQIYIFDSVMKVFGRDIKNNLFIWATFTDEDDPGVLTAVKAHGVEYVTHYSFENGSLYKKVPQEKKSLRKTQGKFEDVYDTFDEFFKRIDQTPPQSLENSKQVLEERSRLREEQASIERDIRKTLEHLEDQKDFAREVQECTDSISSKKECSFYVKMYQKVKGKFYNCELCKVTCCDPCDHNVFAKFFFYECANLKWDNYCKSCSCHSDNHDRSKLRKYAVVRKSLSEIERIQMTEASDLILDTEKSQQIEDAKSLLGDVQSRKENAEIILAKKKEEIATLESHLFNRLNALHNALDKLQQIALYEEKSTVSGILKEIEESDWNRNDPDVKEIYKKLKDYVRQNRL